MNDCCLFGEIREESSEEVTFQHRPERRESVKEAKDWGKRTPCRRNGNCKGLEAGTSVVASKIARRQSGGSWK